jgi:hypothetical protein
MALSRAFGFAEQLRDLFIRTSSQELTSTANTLAIQALSDAAAANTRAEGARTLAVAANNSLNSYKANVNPRIISVVTTAGTANTKAVQALSDAAAANTRAEGARTLAVSANSNLNAYKANTNPRFGYYLQVANVSSYGFATTTYVDNEIAGLVDSSPGTLDTLNELAAALGDDANFATTVSTNLGQKLGATASVTLTGDVTGTASFSSNAVSITTTVADDSHNHVTGNIDGLAEFISDTVGNMVTGNSESGISVTYVDADNTLDFNVNDPTVTLTGAVTGSATMTNLGNISIATTATSDPTLTLSGDASGSATFTNLGNATLSVTVADDSHNHVISNVDGLQTALDAKLPSSGGTLDAYKETSVSATVGTTTYTVNCNTTNTFKLTMTGNPTIAFSNVPTSGTVFSLTLVLVHSGGARTVTFPASVKWQGGTAPTLSASGDTDIITLFTMDGGTNWYASTAGLDFS